MPPPPEIPDRHRLKNAAWGHRTEHRLRVRARIVLHAARGLPNARIAERIGVHEDTVRTRSNRFAEQGMPGLAERKRTGRPPSVTPLRVALVKTLDHLGHRVSRWRPIGGRAVVNRIRRPGRPVARWCRSVRR